MKPSISGTDSLVAFRNSQGTEGRGTLVHLTRNQVVFEVYNPYSIVQLSEVLGELRILRGDRTIYAGRAVVSSLVSTGLMVIVSATLVDPWSDLVGLGPGEGVRDEVREFVREWETIYRLRPSYQLAVSNVRSFLGELSRWLGQVEAVSGLGASSGDPSLVSEFVEEVEEPVTPKLQELFGRFEEEAGQVPEDELDAHKAFARREIHPLALCSPFVHRTYTKPLGYAGDYQMVNMILEKPLEGQNTYARVLNSFNLSQPTAEAHRNRIAILRERLRHEAARAAGLGRPLRVLNVGCGPAAEVERFIREDEESSRCEITLIDFNRETLDHAEARLTRAQRDSGRRPTLHFVHKSIHQLLREVAGGRSEQADEPPWGLVYCAGLFDYLSDRVCKRLVALFREWTAPGGLVVVTNVHPSNPTRYYMEHLLEWYLTYRTEDDMLGLAPDPAEARVFADPTGLNVFLEIRKG